jgi:hypothetical protein
MAGLRGRDKQQDDLIDAAHTEQPEGLKRERKGPGDSKRERNEQVDQEREIPTPGEPAGGE